MAADIGARIGIDGEAQFRSALRITNSDLRVLGTELQSVASQFDRTDRSEQNLTQQNQVLVQSMATQRQHIALLNTELGRQSDNLSRLGRDLEATRTSGENNATAVAAAERAYANQVVVVNRLQTEMNRATTGLNTMERQLTSNQQALNEMGDSTGNATSSLGDLRTRFTEFGQSVATSCKVAVAAIGTIGAAVGGAAAVALKFGDDFKKSLNSLQSETGAAGGEIEDFSDTMKAVYANNFGEDFQDIADTIGTIKQQIGGEWSTKELQKVTENALMMRDTFEFEVNESVRAVDMMMKQFGITSEEAYTLIAQGAQKGLDKNDSLLDSVNEYSVHFKQLGFDSEEMFNMFANGAQSGVFDIDKLGDAVKEFGIRAKDGSTTTLEAYDLLGLSAEDLQAKFLAGGDSAQGAFNEVVAALSNCDNEVVKNTAGVNLFGTMWEDMGTEAVMALSDTNGAISITADTLDKINHVKYDSLGETFTGIGRMLQTELLFPISDKLLPAFTDMAERFKTAFSGEEMQASIDTITEGIADLAANIVDFASNQLPNLIEGFAWMLDHGSEIASGIVAIGAAFATIKLSTLVTGIAGFVSSLMGAGGLTAALSLIGTTIAGLGTTIMGILGGPVTLVVAAIAAIGAGLLTLWNTNEGFRNAVIAAWTAICDTASTIWNGIVVIFTETLPQAIQTALTFFQGIPAMFGTVWDTIGATFQNGWDAIVSFFTVAIPNWITSMGDMFNQLPYLLGNILGIALATAVDWGSSLLTWVTTTVPQIIDSIVKFFAELPGRIWTWLVNTVNKVIEWGKEMGTKAKEGATAAVNSASMAIQQLPGKIWTWLLETIKKVTAWGAQMISSGKTNASAFVADTVAALKALPGQVVSIGADALKGI